MWVLRYYSYGGPEVVERETAERPEPGEGQLLVRVRAVGVNPVDWKIARGDYRIVTGFRPSRTPGADFAGVVEAVGSGVSTFSPGENVFGMVPLLSGGGTCAEFIVVSAVYAVRVPSEISIYDAASIPLSSLTAFRSLFLRGRIAPGAEVLINGASGGVGTAAVQLATIGRGRVTAVASSRNERLCRELGAFRFVDYSSEDPLAGPDGEFDFILDVAGTLSKRRAIAMLRQRGVLVTLNPSPVAFVRAAVPRRDGRRHIVEIVRPDGRHLGRIAAHVRAGRMRPVVEEILPVDHIQEAWRRSMAGHVVGKLVLRFD